MADEEIPSSHPRVPVYPLAHEGGDALSGQQLLRLSRSDRQAARDRLRTLTPEQQARACMELRPALRAAFLELADHPEQLVPLLPEAELAITVRAGGMSEAAWLLEIATLDQRRACFDLDCWHVAPDSDGRAIDLDRAYEWTEALIEAGRPTLVAALAECDHEFWVLLLRFMVDISIPSGEEEKPGEGWFTADGIVYFSPREGVDAGRAQQIFGALAERNPQLYWRFVYGILFESMAECEEEAQRWRHARLADLGFPDREWAMRVYRPLEAEDTPAWTQTPDDQELVPSAELPTPVAGTLIAEALAELPPQRAAEVGGYVLAVANAVAVADGLRLSEPDSIPKALDKAVRGVDAGLRIVSKQRAMRPAVVLDSTRPVDLFRVAATRDPALGPPPPRDPVPESDLEE